MKTTQPTLHQLICEVARAKNLDTSDMVAFAINSIQPRCDFREPVSPSEFARLVARLSYERHPLMQSAKSLLESAYVKVVKMVRQ